MMTEKLTQLPFGFKGKIYRSPMPYGDFDPDRVVFSLYEQANVNIVVMLVSDEEAVAETGYDLRRMYVEQGMRVLYLPIPDFGVPTPEIIAAGLEEVLIETAAGKNVAVHCNAGVGRTGLFMACLARMVYGMSGKQAISWVQQHIEHAVENEAQYSFVQSLDVGQGA